MNFGFDGPGTTIFELKDVSINKEKINIKLIEADLPIRVEHMKIGYVKVSNTAFPNPQIDVTLENIFAEIIAVMPRAQKSAFFLASLPETPVSGGPDFDPETNMPLSPLRNRYIEYDMRLPSAKIPTPARFQRATNRDPSYIPKTFDDAMIEYTQAIEEKKSDSEKAKIVSEAEIAKADATPFITLPQEFVEQIDKVDGLKKILADAIPDRLIGGLKDDHERENKVAEQPPPSQRSKPHIENDRPVTSDVMEQAIAVIEQQPSVITIPNETCPIHGRILQVSSTCPVHGCIQAIEFKKENETSQKKLDKISEKPSNYGQQLANLPVVVQHEPTCPCQPPPPVFQQQQHFIVVPINACPIHQQSFNSPCPVHSTSVSSHAAHAIPSQAGATYPHPHQVVAVKQPSADDEPLSSELQHFVIDNSAKPVPVIVASEPIHHAASTANQEKNEPLPEVTTAEEIVNNKLNLPSAHDNSHPSAVGNVSSQADTALPPPSINTLASTTQVAHSNLGTSRPESPENMHETKAVLAAAVSPEPVPTDNNLQQSHALAATTTVEPVKVPIEVEKPVQVVSHEAFVEHKVLQGSNVESACLIADRITNALLTNAHDSRLTSSDLLQPAAEEELCGGMTVSETPVVKSVIRESGLLVYQRRFPSELVGVAEQQLALSESIRRNGRSWDQLTADEKWILSHEAARLINGGPLALGNELTVKGGMYDNHTVEKGSWFVDPADGDLVQVVYLNKSASKINQAATTTKYSATVPSPLGGKASSSFQPNSGGVGIYELRTDIARDEDFKAAIKTPSSDGAQMLVLKQFEKPITHACTHVHWPIKPIDSTTRVINASPVCFGANPTQLGVKEWNYHSHNPVSHAPVSHAPQPIVVLQSPLNQMPSVSDCPVHPRGFKFSQAVSQPQYYPTSQFPNPSAIRRASFTSQQHFQQQAPPVAFHQQSVSLSSSCPVHHQNNSQYVSSAPHHKSFCAVHSQGSVNIPIRMHGEHASALTSSQLTYQQQQQQQHATAFYNHGRDHESKSDIFYRHHQQYYQQNLQVQGNIPYGRNNTVAEITPSRENYMRAAMNEYRHEAAKKVMEKYSGSIYYQNGHMGGRK